MLTIVSWLWTDPTNHRASYHPAHVRRWAAMVRRNLTIDHRLVCITDQPTADFGSDVTAIPLWDDLADMGQCWRRLRAFAPDMYHLLGPRFAWMDLDCAVTGDLTLLLDRPEPAVFWQPRTVRTPYNGSLVLMTAGARAKVWHDWPGPEKARAAIAGARYTGSDQAWWSTVLGTGETVWTQRDGAYPFWQDCFNGRPDNARVVFFPGRLKSNADFVRQTAPWVQQALDAALPIDEPVTVWPNWPDTAAGRRILRGHAPKRQGVMHGRDRRRARAEMMRAQRAINQNIVIDQ